MTKAELIKSLDGLPDDQYICVLMNEGKDFNTGNQIIIQAVEQFPPWHDAKHDKSNWLVGIRCSSTNAEIPTSAMGAEREAGYHRDIDAKNEYLDQMQKQFDKAVQETLQ